MKFFDSGLRLASRGHFMVLRARDQAGFRRRYLETSEAKILEILLINMGSGSIFGFWSKSLAIMVVEIYIPHKSPKIG